MSHNNHLNNVLMVIVIRSGLPFSITNHWLWSDEGCDFSTGRQSWKLHKENKKRTVIRSITIIILSQCLKSPNWFGTGIMKGITRINSSSASNHQRASSICKYKFHSWRGRKTKKEIPILFNLVPTWKKTWANYIFSDAMAGHLGKRRWI